MPGDRPRLGDTLPLLRGRRPAAVHRERDQHRSASSASPTARPTSRTASTTTSSTARASAVNPEQNGTKAAAHYALTVRPASASRSAAPADCRAVACRQRHAAAALRAAFDDVFAARASEADEFYAAITPALADRRRGQRHAPGAGGDAVEQAVLPLRRGQVARGARLRPVQGDPQGRHRATTTGTTCTTATSSPCRTSGSIPGTRPGTSPSTSSP